MRKMARRCGDSRRRSTLIGAALASEHASQPLQTPLQRRIAPPVDDHGNSAGLQHAPELLEDGGLLVLGDLVDHMITRYGVDRSGLDRQIGEVRLKVGPTRAKLAARYPQRLGRKVDADPPLEV